MKDTPTTRKLATGLAFGTLTLLAACGGGSGNGTTTVGGVAATGAPIAGGSLALRCLNNYTNSTTTDSNGRWSLGIPSANLPCVAQVTPAGGGQSYYAPVIGAIANVTPLTSLALAAGTGSAPDATAFSQVTDADLRDLAANLGALISNLKTVLTNAGFTLPANFDPFAAAFNAAAGDPYDQLLEDLKTAISNAGTDFQTVLNNAANNQPLPAAQSTAEVSGNITASGATSATDFFSKLAGTYKLKVTSVGAEGASAAAASILPLNSVRTVLMESNGNVSIRGEGQTLSYTYTPHTLSDFTGSATTLNEMRYYANSGSGIDLYISYDPGSGKLKVEPAGFTSNHEGYATLESNPRTNTSTSTSLAARIGSAFAGSYQVSCSDNGNAANHTIVIASDGSSSVDGTPVADTTHKGSISVKGSGVFAHRNDGTQTYPSFGLQFGSDGTLKTTAVNTVAVVAGSPKTCTGVSGHITPSAYSQATVSAGYARTLTVNCTAHSAHSSLDANTPQGQTTFTLGSDGSYVLGQLHIAPADYNAYQQYEAIDNATFQSYSNDLTLSAGSSTSSGTVNIALQMNADNSTKAIQFQNSYDSGSCTL